MESVQEDHRFAANKSITTVIYALYAATVFAGVTYFVAIVLNYVKRDDVRGTFLESHFTWQMRTFWYSLLWSVLCFVTIPILIGIAGYFALFVWFVYRIVKGWLRLSENRPMYMDA